MEGAESNLIVDYTLKVGLRIEFIMVTGYLSLNFSFSFDIYSP